MGLCSWLRWGRRGLVLTGVAQELDPVFEALDLDGDLTWNDQVLEAPNTGDASSRTFLRGDGTWASVGLQDAAYAILTADVSTMSSTYTTMMSATVTVGDADDAVRVDVTAYWAGWSGRCMWWTTPAMSCGRWRGLTIRLLPLTRAASRQDWIPRKASRRTAGPSTWWIARTTVVPPDANNLWRCADPTSPGSCTLQGNFPSGLPAPRGITSHGGAVYVVDAGVVDELWRCADPTSPGTCVSQGNFPAGLAEPRGITSHGGAVYVVDVIPAELWRCTDPTSPGSCTQPGQLPVRIGYPARHHVVWRGPLRGGSSRRAVAVHGPDKSRLVYSPGQLPVRIGWPARHHKYR